MAWTLAKVGAGSMSLAINLKKPTQARSFTVRSSSNGISFDEGNLVIC